MTAFLLFTSERVLAKALGAPRVPATRAYASYTRRLSQRSAAQRSIAQPSTVHRRAPQPSAAQPSIAQPGQMLPVHANRQAGGCVCRASELKEELARLSLPTNGSRQQLENRLMEHYQMAMQQDAQYEALSQQVHLLIQLLFQLLVQSSKPILIVLLIQWCVSLVVCNEAMYLPAVVLQAA